MKRSTPFLLQTMYGLLAHALIACAHAGFPNPDPDYVFSFPKDHGNHPAFKIEWWYVIGHLYADTDSQQRYGFQATFFRNREHPVSATPQQAASPTFGETQIYMAHMSLTDLRAKKYQHETRLNRDGWNAYSRENTLDLRNGDWTFHLTADDNNQERFMLHATIGGVTRLQLQFQPLKPRVLFGEPGSSVSIKGDEPDARSYYITYTRLATNGTLTIDDQTIPVSGEAWMDHEISSNQVGAEIKGWDWTCIQFKDGRELKAYRLRTENTQISPHSRLIWIDQTNTLTYRKPDAYEWIEDGYWTSPETGARYPNRVILQTKDPQTQQTVRYSIIPLYAAQEMTDTISDIQYWEGACTVEDAAGRTVGNAYLELTGYAKDLSPRQ